MIHEGHHDYDSVLSTLLGGVFSFFITAVNHPITHAFAYGFVGALGGLVCKILYSKFVKKRKN
jgi:uncharacterized YccA/Bax inhibitor family protein